MPQPAPRAPALGLLALLLAAPLAPVLAAAPDKAVPAKPAPAKPASSKAVTSKAVTSKPAKPAPPADTTGSVAREDFGAFLAALWPDARARGVSRATYDAATAGLAPDPKVAALTRGQAEFAKPMHAYLDGAVGAVRVRGGAAKAAEYAEVLATIERRSGVDRRVVLAIWGLETSYGGFTGSTPTLRALATLAHQRYRGAFFRDELLAALEILERTGLAPGDLKGSWAGAFGQTQFMPSSYLKHAKPYAGDFADVWNDPKDALASTANYLKDKGWVPGLPWGFEVVLPEGFDLAQGRRNPRQGFERWRALGVARADGEAFPRGGDAGLFLPEGAAGPAFLVTANFAVIKTYNQSDAYALAVGHLGDRAHGGGALRASWPRAAARLDIAAAKEVQRRLKALGHDVGEVDGRFGERARAAVQEYQAARRLPADGHPTPALLARLRTEGR